MTNTREGNNNNIKGGEKELGSDGRQLPKALSLSLGEIQRDSKQSIAK